MIKQLIKIKDEFKTLPRKIDSSNDIYKYFTNDIPNELNLILKRQDLIIKGSIGKGYKTDHPWIAVLNKNITRSTQKGVYVVFLFKSDMSGFYLTLNQGITNFEQKFDKQKYEYAIKVANYFKSILNESKQFTTSTIDLVSQKGSLGYGYESTTILSKFYDYKFLNEDTIIKDLKDMVEIYDDIYENLGHITYDQIIDSIISKTEIIYYEYDKAIDIIESTLEEESLYPKGTKKNLIEVKATLKKESKYKEINQKVPTKIDYIKKASKDAMTGTEGEKLALEYERDRLIAIGLQDYITEIKYVANHDDSAGYDILSYDKNNKNKIIHRYIEVKTSISKADSSIFVSKNEVNKSIELNDRYFIYRIYDSLSVEPKIYIAQGSIRDNFDLDPVTYSAIYKWKVE
jgi:hypothetical protein